MSAFEYCARYDFPSQCVTYNKGTKDQFVTSIHDEYSHSLEDLLNTKLSDIKCVDLSKVSWYKRIVWKRNPNTDYWSKVCEDTLVNNSFKQKEA